MPQIQKFVLDLEHVLMLIVALVTMQLDPIAKLLFVMKFMQRMHRYVQEKEHVLHQIHVLVPHQMNGEVPLVIFQNVMELFPQIPVFVLAKEVVSHQTLANVIQDTVVIIVLISIAVVSWPIQH